MSSASALHGRIFFIARTFPPVQGGIEQHNFWLSQALSRQSATTVVANPHGKNRLPFFMIKAIWRLVRDADKNDVVLVGDGVGAVTGWAARKLGSRADMVVIIHGLDITFPHRCYQHWWVQRFIASARGVIAVSSATADAMKLRLPGGPAVVVIPNGVGTLPGIPPLDQVASPASPTSPARPTNPQVELSQTNNSCPPPLEAPTLITVGRLIERKGVAWFIRAVLPLLPEWVTYAVVGSGPQRGEIQAAIRDGGLQHRVRLYGQVSDEEKVSLVTSATLFVQPNVHVPGDMEGFGIAPLESAYLGTPVVAADLEGLTDAIIPDRNGVLVPSEDAHAFASVISDLLNDSERLLELKQSTMHYTRQSFQWQHIAQRYLEACATFTSPSSSP